MLFNPEESVDFAGNTGPVYSIHVRSNSIYFTKTTLIIQLQLRTKLHEKKELIEAISTFPEVIQNLQPITVRL
jgi:arginyl-tRNA synthetase